MHIHDVVIIKLGVLYTIFKGLLLYYCVSHISHLYSEIISSTGIHQKNEIIVKQAQRRAAMGLSRHKGYI